MGAWMENLAIEDYRFRMASLCLYNVEPVFINSSFLPSASASDIFSPLSSIIYSILKAPVAL